MTDMENERRELHKQKSELVLSKLHHQTKLSTIKTLLRTGGVLPNEKYKQCCESQTKHSRDILNIENRISQIKTRLREIADAQYEAKQSVKLLHEQPASPPNSQDETSTRSIVVELVALRHEYQNFAADGTRVSSMRQMAAEFVLKLNPIIKRAIGTD